MTKSSCNSSSTSISVVTSLYYSQKHILEFYSRAKAAIEKLNLNYEFIFVDDGSPDNSGEQVKRLIARDKQIKLIELSRNFGQHAAMFAGLAHATGDLVYASDCDLEEAPELIIDFYKTLINTDELDVVFGVVKERKGGFFRRKLGQFFFYILHLLTEYNIPQNQSWARLMKKHYVKSLLRFQETETFAAGLMHITGFKQKVLPIDKHYKGSTTYTPFKRLSVALTAIASFSSKPLIYISALGLIIFISAFVFIAYIIIGKTFFTDFQAGWSSLIASIWCVGGLIIFCIGVIGFYIAKVFNQVKSRPLYIVRAIHKKN